MKDRTTLIQHKTEPIFPSKGAITALLCVWQHWKHCASFCSMDCTQPPVSHLEATVNAIKVSSTGAASLSYCTDQNPSQNTCRIQAKFNYDFSFSTHFLFSTFQSPLALQATAERDKTIFPSTHCLQVVKLWSHLLPGRKKIAATSHPWQMQVPNPVEMAVLSSDSTGEKFLPIFPLTCQ